MEYEHRYGWRTLLQRLRLDGVGVTDVLMAMTPSRFLVVLLFSSFVAVFASAQVEAGAGASFGMQAFHDNTGYGNYDPVGSLEVFGRKERWAVELAVQGSDSVYTRIYLIHADVAWRALQSGKHSFWVGAGPTFVNTSETNITYTGNVEGVYLYDLGRWELLGRVRFAPFETGGGFRENGVQSQELGLFAGVRVVVGR